MSSDERIERSTDRHEVLAQGVELLAAEDREQSKVVDAMVDEINGLVRIVQSHQSRLSHLEGG